MSQDPVQVIEDSTLFDADWYLRSYPDVWRYDRSPAHHYSIYGAHIGRDPGPGFSSAGYLARNTEVAQVGHNPLWHYELYGKHEGREPSPSDLATQPPDSIRQSEIDRSQPVPLPAAAHVALTKVFDEQLEERPHRFLAEFDHVGAQRFISNLCAQEAAELAARNTRVSVIMPTFNRAATLGRAIQSVMGQSHHNMELIVVDDGSTDSTADVVKEYHDDPRVVYCATPHLGVSAARNLGLSRAKGSVIFYLDSDNLWTCDFVRLMLIALQVSGARCAYAATRLHNRAGAVVGYRGEPFDWAHCINGNYVDLNVFCHEIDLTRKLGCFDETLRRMVDWDLILRYTHENAPVYCPFIGCLYSDDPDDRTRISTSKPYIFERVVSHKNAFGLANLPEVLTDLRFSFALKTTSGSPVDLVDGLSATLSKRGNRVRIDDQEKWEARHPHEDEVVLILPGASAYTPHPEQFNLRLGSAAESQVEPEVHGSVEIDQCDAAKIADEILNQIIAYLKGVGE